MKATHITIITFLVVALGAPCLQAADLDESLAQFAKYKDDDSVVAVKAIEAAAYRASNSPKAKAALASKLIALLESKSATIEAKNLTCQLLPLIADAAAVKPLVALLGDPKTATAARGALQRLSGPQAAKALRDAMGKATGSAKVGLINSIGAKRDAQAAAALKALLTDKDADIASAATAALGEIGNAEAVAALTDAKLKPTGALLDALLQCAETNADSAASVYKRLSASSDDNWKWAGLTGLAKSSPADALAPLSAILNGPETKHHARALSLIATLPGEKVTKAMIARMAKCPNSGQILFMGALAQRGDQTAADAVAEFLGDKDADVKSAAINAIGKLGGARHIAVLAKIASAENNAFARASLASLPAKDVDAALISGISKGAPAIRTELIAASAARGVKDAAEAMLAAAKDSDATVRKAACKGLAQLAGKAELPKIVALLASASDAADQQGLSQAILATGRRIDDNPAVSKAILVGLKTASGQPAAALLKTVAYFGGAEALPTVVQRVEAKDTIVSEAAIRSLTTWPDAEACGPLLKIISGAKNAKHRILAMRGYFRLAPLSTDPAGALAKIRKLVKTPADKRMMLSALSAAGSTEAMDMAISMLSDAEVKSEAALAAIAIGGQLASTQKAAVLAAMEKVRATDPSKSILAKIDGVEKIAKQRRRRGRTGPARKSYDKKAVDARKKQLAAAAPKG